MKNKRIPERLCVGCRQMKPKTELLRVVRTPDGEPEFDPKGKRDGRGAYICRDVSCIRAACTGKGLERSFRTGISMEKRELLLKEMTAFVEQ